MDISNNMNLPIAIIDKIARDALDNVTSGVSASRDVTRIHLTDNNHSHQTTAQAILENYDSLTISADKITLSEGDADPVITCSDTTIAGDSEMAYVVLLDGVLYADGTTAILAGSASLTLVSPLAGVYEIVLYRTADTYASGTIAITVNEV